MIKKLSFLAVSALFLSACSNTTAPISGTTEQKAEKLAQIMASGGSADCKVTSLEDKTTTQIVISGKKMKFIGSDMGEGKKGTMLNDGKYTYIWSEGEKTGFKSKVEEVTPTGTTANPQEQEFDTNSKVNTFDDASKYKLDCTKRSITDTDFTPPADVKFTDFSEMMQGIPTLPTTK